MARIVTATLDANAEECGPVYVADKATCIVRITSGSAITITPHVSHDQSGFVALTDDALTASGAILVEGPCVVKLVASGVTTTTAVCSIQAER
jgi:hypothetical protein